MEFEGFLYAYKVSEAKSIKKASEILSVSQPSIINKLKLLENNLGFDIFIKSNKGVILTSEGKEFIQKIKPMILYYTSLNNKYLINKNNKITLASNHSLIAKEYYFNYLNFSIKDTEFDFINIPTKEILAKLLSNEINIAILTILSEELSILPFKRLSKNYKIETLSTDDAVLYLSSPLYEAYKNKAFTIKDSLTEIALKTKILYPKDIILDNISLNTNILKANNYEEVIMYLNNSNSFYIGSKSDFKFFKDFNIKFIPYTNQSVYFKNILIYNIKYKEIYNDFLSSIGSNKVYTS